MGTTRAALHYYVKNKDELLTRLVEGVTLDGNVRREEIAQDPALDASSKLRDHDCVGGRARDVPGQAACWTAARGISPRLSLALRAVRFPTHPHPQGGLEGTLALLREDVERPVRLESGTAR